MHEQESAFLDVKNRLDADEALQHRAKLGLCRPWTGRVLDILDRMEGVVAEARETKDGTHTFVQITIGNETYILDGVGHKGMEPYYGVAVDAPSTLQDNEVDMITIY